MMTIEIHVPTGATYLEALAALDAEATLLGEEVVARPVFVQADIVLDPSLDADDWMAVDRWLAITGALVTVRVAEESETEHSVFLTSDDTPLDERVATFGYPDEATECAARVTETLTARRLAIRAHLDPRPVAPTYRATDVTDWTLEDILEQQALDDADQEYYAADLAAWERRNPDAAAALEGAEQPVTEQLDAGATSLTERFPRIHAAVAEHARRKALLMGELGLQEQVVPLELDDVTEQPVHDVVVDSQGARERVPQADRHGEFAPDGHASDAAHKNSPSVVVSGDPSVGAEPVGEAPPDSPTGPNTTGQVTA